MKIVFLLALITSSTAFAFDYDSYEKETLDGVISRSNTILDSHVGDEGIDIINPVLPFALYETLSKMPYKCDSGSLIKFMGMVGFVKEQLPPINYCINVKSESGADVTFYVQDTLVKHIKSEAVVGSKIRIWAIWVFSNGFDHLPRLLMNEFEAPIPNKSVKQTV